METAQIIIVEGRRGREGEKNSSNISVIWLVQIMFFYGAALRVYGPMLLF